MGRRFHSDGTNIEAMRKNGRFLDTAVFKSDLILAMKLITDHLSLCFYTPAKAMNKLFLDTISMPSVSNYISRQAGHYDPSITASVYQTFNVSHANRYELVKSGCNLYVSEVLSPCTELTTFKTSNLKKGG